jgi:catechol-2,3-dioxygenase
MRSEGGLVISLTAHEGTPGGRFDERRVGLDHLSIACEDRAEVEAWERHLNELGVEHGELVDAGYGHVLTSRDPDGIPVEFFAPAAQ